MDLINEPIIDRGKEETRRRPRLAHRSWRHEVEERELEKSRRGEGTISPNQLSARQSGGFQNQGEKVPAGGSDQLSQGHRFRQILRHARGVRQNQRRGGMKRISTP